MKTLSILFLLGATAFLSFQNYKQGQEIKNLRGELGIEDSSGLKVERSLTVEDHEDENSRSISTRTSEKVSGLAEKLPFNQFFDTEKAFKEDQLFAVMSKKTYPAESYTDKFDKNAFGNPKTKTHPAVYILRCLGRETRENYLFIVDRRFYDTAAIHQKFTQAELSNFESFLSEEKLDRTIFTRRFRGKMID